MRVSFTKVRLNARQQFMSVRQAIERSCELVSTCKMVVDTNILTPERAMKYHAKLKAFLTGNTSQSQQRLNPNSHYQTFQPT